MKISTRIVCCFLLCMPIIYQRYHVVSFQQEYIEPSPIRAKDMSIKMLEVLPSIGSAKSRKLFYMIYFEEEKAKQNLEMLREKSVKKFHITYD
ncbi:MAG TPA: hypothetical protein PKM32_09935 [Planctomycetota bacterium]|nr:hypothetical protein [Planctomycetota bacterium]HPY75511.1 hypothetical protein [Planctomycetota bacterium]HQB01124.1 hypothetical protein [Planctomycetota bacterium]